MVTDFSSKHVAVFILLAFSSKQRNLGRKQDSILHYFNRLSWDWGVQESGIFSKHQVIAMQHRENELTLIDKVFAEKISFLEDLIDCLGICNME